MPHPDLRIEADGQISVNPLCPVGVLGEAIAAQWLITQGWRIVHHRWHCRWGELDLVAHHPAVPEGDQEFSPSSLLASCQDQLVFVEVKVRNLRNWDANGLMAITPKKQQKLWKTAELFLSSFPQWATVPCRFDVLLLQYRRSPRQLQGGDRPPPSYLVLPAYPANQSWITLGQYQLRIKYHVKHAFEH